MNNLTSAAWWKAAMFRALRTVLVIATPYVPTVLYDGNYLIVASAALFGGVSSIITSLFGIAETSDKSVSWYWALAERVIKTTAQALLVLFGTATMFQDVAWAEAPQLIGTAILGSLLLAFMKGMPESDAPIALAQGTIITVNEAGKSVEAAVPVVANVEEKPSGTSLSDSGDGRIG